MKNYQFVAVSTCFILLSSSVYADQQLKRSTQVIDNLDKTINTLVFEKKMPIMFPKQIPVPDANTEYYAALDYSSSNPDQLYDIQINTTPECKGENVCNIGHFIASRNTIITETKSKNNKEVTSEVILKNGARAYFTEGHAGADYTNPSVQWLAGQVRYTLVWKADKAALTAMTDSAFPTNGMIPNHCTPKAAIK